MAREVVKLTEDHPMYTELTEGIQDGMKPENLLIVARGEANHKGDNISPVEVKNGIYFYVAYRIGERLVYPAKYSTEDIYTAKANTVAQARVGNMFDVLMDGAVKLEDYSFPGEDELDQMTIITNVRKVNGSGILYCEEYLKKVKDRIGDYYILPSSIHELIIVPEKMGDQDFLNHMVQDVNRNEVDDEDLLADRAYKVDEWI